MTAVATLVKERLLLREHFRKVANASSIVISPLSEMTPLACSIRIRELRACCMHGLEAPPGVTGPVFGRR